MTDVLRGVSTAATAVSIDDQVQSSPSDEPLEALAEGACDDLLAETFL